MTILPQRPLRGSRISSFYPIKNLPSLSSLDSAFQLQEYISLLIRLDVHDVEAIVSLPGRASGKEKDGENTREWDRDKEKEDDMIPIDAEDADDKSKSDVTVDEACWIYEQLRRLAQDLTHPLITMLQQECTRSSCPEMKAGEWLYLCVAHGNEGATEQCCAIDYILHTLDSATALLNTPRAFPSRLQIPPTSHRHFSSLARRLGRIFAHAYFHHREAFEQAEAESSLYARFLVLTSKFELVPPEFLVIPARMEPGDERGDREHDSRNFGMPPMRLMSASADSRSAAPERERDIPHQPLQRNVTMRSIPGGRQWDYGGSVAPAYERAKSHSPPGLKNGNGTESPRKIGRNRTDTMVLHEPFPVMEEPKVESEDKGLPEPEGEAQDVIVPRVLAKIPMIETQEDLPSITDGFSDATKSHAGSLEEYQHLADSLPESPIIKSPPASSPPHLPLSEVGVPIIDVEDTEDKPTTGTTPALSDLETAEVAAQPFVEDVSPEPIPQESILTEADIVEEAVNAESPPTATPASPPTETASVPASSETTEASQEEKPEPIKDAEQKEEDTDKVVEEEHPVDVPSSSEEAASDTRAAEVEPELSTKTEENVPSVVDVTDNVDVSQAEVEQHDEKSEDQNEQAVTEEVGSESEETSSDITTQLADQQVEPETPEPSV